MVVSRGAGGMMDEGCKKDSDGRDRFPKVAEAPQRSQEADRRPEISCWFGCKSASAVLHNTDADAGISLPTLKGKI